MFYKPTQMSKIIQISFCYVLCVRMYFRRKYFQILKNVNEDFFAQQCIKSFCLGKPTWTTKNYEIITFLLSNLIDLEDI